MQGTNIRPEPIEMGNEIPFPIKINIWHNQRLLLSLGLFFKLIQFIRI